MKCAADFRSIARDALRGKWLVAIAAGLIAALLGGSGSGGPEINFNVDESGANASLEYAEQTILSTSEGLNSEIGAFLLGGAFVVGLIALALAVVFFVLGSIVEVGYARFNLELVDGVEPAINSLFHYFYNWKTTVAAKFLQGLYVFLWSLLLFIPGIIASYSYAMTSYILADHPELTASEAITQSKEMMEGNRFRLFCLQLSFIGWGILCIFTFGIGNLWLTPYIQAATAAFYREVSGTEYVVV